jgi:hypothetical protein
VAAHHLSHTVVRVGLPALQKAPLAWLRRCMLMHDPWRVQAESQASELLTLEEVQQIAARR